MRLVKTVRRRLMHGQVLLLLRVLKLRAHGRLGHGHHGGWIELNQLRLPRLTADGRIVLVVV